MVKRNVDILINAQDRASKQFGKVSKSTERFANNLVRTSKAGISTEAMLVGMGAAATVAAAAWVGLRESFMQAAEFEQLNVAFETLIGNLDKSQMLMRKLMQFSLRTPFEPDQVLRLAKALAAFGIETGQVSSLIGNLGELSAGTGTSLERLGDIVGKIFTKGRAQAEELNRFAEAGIPIIQELAKMYGKTEAEILKMASAGKIGFGEIQQALQSMTNEGGKFFGLMEKQSKTQIGLWSTLTGVVKETGKGIGNFLLPVTKALTQTGIDLVDVINEVVDGFNIMAGFRDQTLGRGAIEREPTARASDQQILKNAEMTTAQLQQWVLESQKVEQISKRYGINIAEAQALIAQSTNDQKIMIFELEKEKALRERIAANERRDQERARAAFEGARATADKSMQALQQQIDLQKLLNDGKERQAFIQEGINRTIGKGLTQAEIDKIAKLRGELFDIQKQRGEGVPVAGQKEPLTATVSRFLSLRQQGGPENRTAEENQKNNKTTAQNTQDMKVLIAALLDQIKNSVDPFSAASFGV